MGRILFAAVAGVCLCGAQTRPVIAVNESKIRASLQADSTVVSIPVESTFDREIAADLALSWVETNDAESSSVHQHVKIPPGKKDLEVPLKLMAGSIWLRLRYTLTPDVREARAFSPQAGILSIAHIADHVFELKASFAGTPYRGRTITLTAKAVHPVTHASLPGVRWEAVLKTGDEEVAPLNVTRHDGGFVDFTFEIPPAGAGDKSEDDDSAVGADIAISAKLGDFEQKLNVPLQLSNRLSATFQTDKPIYQPGQPIHIRAIVTGSQGKAASNAKVALRIENDDAGRVHSIRLETSRFGVVQDDWTLPDSASLGTYRIVLTAQGNDYEIANHSVRVSRYELPTFNVTVKPDRTAYLPGQQALVTVTGVYLFGKAVAKGRVKIVQSRALLFGRSSRRKPDESDKTVAEGQAGADGSFAATIDLSEAQEDFKRFGDRRTRYEDLHFAAYETDPLSGRTEQRRFDLRVTAEPVHVYVVESERATGLPAPLYVSTSYADGRPAATSVEVRYQGRVFNLRTNAYGVGKIYLPFAGTGPEEIELHATDSTGQSGTWTENYWSRGSAHLRIEADRTLHRQGDPVVLRITAPPQAPPNQSVMVHALIEDRLLATRIVSLVDRKGEVTFPYQPNFRRTVVFAAWGDAREEEYRFAADGFRAVIFPDRSDLRVSASTERASYKPGDDASLRMQVSELNGKPVEAALGVAVVDQAVLERARSDADFGQRPWFSCAFCGNPGEREVGGVRLNDLYALKPSTRITPELDLVAETLMAGAGASIWNDSSESLGNRPQFPDIPLRMSELRKILEDHYASTFEFPRDIAALTRILGYKWWDLKDPWGKPYSAKFGVERDQDVISLISSGPDQRLGTADDFVAETFRRAYFTPARLLIDQILKSQVDYPATAEEVRLLRDNGLLLDTLRDPWGTAYRPSVLTRGPTRYVSIQTAGPDGIFGTPDDVAVATFQGTYFNRQSQAISKALSEAATPPQSNEDFGKILQSAGIDVAKYRDAWNNPYRVTSKIASYYEDRTTTSTVRVYGQEPVSRMDVNPVTRQYITFALRSEGPDGEEDTFDDFNVAEFPILLREESAGATQAAAGNLAEGTGSISGTVTDPAGAVVPGAKVTVVDAAMNRQEINAGPEGRFRLSLIPSGFYTVRVQVPGFLLFEARMVPVADGQDTPLEIALELGAATEAITVTASAPLMQTMSAEAGDTYSPAATPRVRDYFPETLVWLPELVTDVRGRASTSLKLADTVTTWKIAVIASTVDGRIAEADSDLRAFQPFSLDFNPPAVLTEGDKLELPVTVRNYEDHRETVEVRAHANDWSSIEGAADRKVAVPKNDSVNVSYAIQARRSEEKGLQRISARTVRAGDAIEKPIRVHPDGQEVSQTAGDLVIGKTSFRILIPPSAIRGATRAELRLYPNIASMLLESASAVLIEPHGCAEQTISAGYSNLIALRFARAAGIADPKIEKTALLNVRAAKDALPGFQDGDGGVRYWSTGDPDVGVTAYALSFLVDAAQEIGVEKEELELLADWLEKHQASDGIWKSKERDPETNQRQNTLLTSLVVKSLAMAKKAGVEGTVGALAGAYHHVARFTDQIDEPYVLAQFILAATDSGDESLLGNAVTRLAGLAREERGGLYWDLQTNSPFYGWGTAGRLETTGLAVSALAKWRARHPSSTEQDTAIRRGALFVLRNRDHYGSWYSTQATVRAMEALADASAVFGNLGGGGGTIDVQVRGRRVKSVKIPDDPRATDPILVDLGSSLGAGENEVELTGSSGVRSLLAYATSIHWMPWTDAQVRKSAELRLAVQFDRVDAQAGEAVRCSVRAERVGFKGYGMMLAEIGLPPGAEVDRSTLEELLENAELGISRYDILPDRVILYLWPKAGGVSFDFGLHLRMPMQAKSAASVLYDYYNPEALSEVAPVSWNVK